MVRATTKKAASWLDAPLEVMAYSILITNLEFYFFVIFFLENALHESLL